MRGSSQKRIYTSHIRGVSPTEAWRTEGRKALLFTLVDAPRPTPRSCQQDGHMAPCAGLFTPRSSLELGRRLFAVLSGGMHQRRGRSPAQEGRNTCFCEMKFHPSWINPLSHGVSSQNLPPVSTHRKNRYRCVQNTHLERSDFSFNLGSSANLYSG